MKLTLSFLEMLWGAKISRVKKFFLIMLFSGGVFVIMAGILRAYFILTGGRKGGVEAAHWGMREAFVAFVIGNAPMIYGGIKTWLRKCKNSKVYAKIGASTKDWPGADKFSGLFSRAGRSRAHVTSEKPWLPKNLAKLGVTGTSNSSEPSRQSRLPWGHTRSDSPIDTRVNKRDTRTNMDPEFGIQVTRGIRVDVESVKSRESDPETIETRGKHSRTDSEAQLGPFLMDSPPEKSSCRRAAELPSHERPVRRSVLQIPDNPQQRRSGTPDGANDTKWINDDSF